MKFAYATAAAAALIFGSNAQAAVTISVQQSGTSVIISQSGSLNTTGLTALPRGSVVGAYTGASAGLGVIRFGPTAFFTDLVEYSISGPTSFGSGSFENSTTTTGDVFSINGFFQTMMLSTSYVSGSSLSSSMSFANTTVARLGFRTSSFAFSIPNDTVAVNVLSGDAGGDVGAVPEPATWAMMVIGFVLAGRAMRVRRRRVVMAV
jgi:hypothetical protein